MVSILTLSGIFDKSRTFFGIFVPNVAALSIFIKSSGPSNCIVVKRNEERLILAALSTIYSFYIPTSLYNSLVSLFQYSPIRYFTLIQYKF